MIEITEIEIKKRLEFDNPWWQEGAIPKKIADWRRRTFFRGFIDLVQLAGVNRAVVLMGPRRVGKTVMLTHAVQRLIDDGVDPVRILYVAVDTPAYTGIPLERLLVWFMEIHRHARHDQLFVIFDEIQYHRDWERHLKSLVDSYPAMRFVASGSAAAALKMKSDESGAGRFTDFLLPPLNFAEFLRFSDRENQLIDRDAGNYDTEGLNDAFVDYINFGGFPEAVNSVEIRNSMDRFVADDIVDKVLLRDLPSLYGIRDTQELKRFFTVLAYNTGSEVSYIGLAKASGVAQNTLRKYLDYLEAAFLIFRLHRVDRNAKRFKRVTRFKVYLTIPSIRAALFGPVGPDDAAMGLLAETAMIGQLTPTFLARHLNYARWDKGEVDLVTLDQATQTVRSAAEFKWSDRAARRPNDELNSLLSFCRANRLGKAHVGSRSSFADPVCDGVTIAIRPVSALCYISAATYIEDSVHEGLDPRSLLPFGTELLPRQLAQPEP